jgi:hypothetical protein
MASAKREQEAVLCFVVYEKKRRCFSPSAQKMLVSSTTKQINASTSVVHIEALHTLMDKVYRVKSNFQVTIVFTKVITKNS